jgi:hypothetical protein
MNFNFEPLVDNVPIGMTMASAVRNESCDLLGEKQSGNLVSLVYLERNNPLVVTDELAESLHNSVLVALAIGQKIDSRSSTSYVVQIVSHCKGYVTVDGRVASEFVNDDPMARTAAVVHEGIHHLQEDMEVVGWNDNPEALPNLAEFLFTKGGIRLGYFRRLYEMSFDEQTEDQYHLAMRDIRGILHDESTTPSDDGYRAMRQKVKAMSEGEKVEMIKGVIGGFTQQMIG